MKISTAKFVQIFLLLIIILLGQEVIQLKNLLDKARSHSREDQSDALFWKIGLSKNYFSIHNKVSDSKLQFSI